MQKKEQEKLLCPFRDDALLQHTITTPDGEISQIIQLYKMAACMMDQCAMWKYGECQRRA